MEAALEIGNGSADLSSVVISATSGGFVPPQMSALIGSLLYLRLMKKMYRPNK